MLSVRNVHAGVAMIERIIARIIARIMVKPSVVTDTQRESGFTLVEVMIATLIGTIGLLGTLAVQQTITSASKNANDAAIAMRLASQKLDELSSRSTDTAAADAAMGLRKMITDWPNWWPHDAAKTLSVPEYVNAEGVCLCESDANLTPKVPQAGDIGTYRWRRQWKIVDPGTAGSPYVISVIVSYNNDVGTTKTTRLDLERRKAW
jgi:prepilin-type N-terminal cleavage/methylation domain-containing protein